MRSGERRTDASRRRQTHDVQEAPPLSEDGRRPVRIFGVPMDLGQDRRGVDMGPSAIRYARIDESLKDLSHSVTDLEDAGVPNPETVAAEEGVKQLAAIKSVCEEVCHRAAG